MRGSAHTDRGSQYCSNDFQALLRQYEMRSSMGCKGDCWDNAVAESCFHSFKVEAVQGEVFTSRAGMREAVLELLQSSAPALVARLHESGAVRSKKGSECRCPSFDGKITIQGLPCMCRL